MNPKEKIRKMSRALKVLCSFLLLFAPILNICYWLTNGLEFFGSEWQSALRMTPTISEMPPLSQLSFGIKCLGMVINFIPIGIFMLALSYLKRLFGLYAEFKIFSKANVRTIRSLGITLLIGQLIYPIYCGLITLAMTISNPPGHRMIMVNLGSDQLLLLMIATIIILVSWIMDEGRKLEEEQEATV